MKEGDAFLCACASVCAALVLIGSVLLLVALLATAPETQLLHSHIYRLPSNAKQTGVRTWTSVEANSTVLVTYVIFAEGDDVRNDEGTCCEWIGGRLKEGMPYKIEAANDGTFSSYTILSVCDQSLSRWEAVVGNIVGERTVGESAGFVLNGENSISLGILDVPAPNALAVTALWQRCKTPSVVTACPERDLEIFEWKMSFDTVNRPWAVDGRRWAYDFFTTFSHEWGHVFGIGHPKNGCSHSVMAPSLQKGELKRNLDDDTKDCARALYEVSKGNRAATNAIILLIALVAM